MGTPVEKAISGRAIFAKPEAIIVDKKNYEAFFFESCFKFTQVLEVSFPANTFTELFSHPLDQPVNLTEEAKEKLRRLYGNLFESEALESAWLRRVTESRNSEEAIRLIQFSQHVKSWNSISRFLDNVVVMEATFQEIEERGRLMQLAGHIGLSSHFSLFGGSPVDSIRKITEQIFEEQAIFPENGNKDNELTALSKSEKVEVLVAKIKAYAETLATMDSVSIPSPDHLLYFYEPADKTFPADPREDPQNWFFVSRIIKQNFEKAFSKFQTITGKSLSVKMQEEGLDPDESDYIWSLSFFDGLYKQISNTNPVNKVREEEKESKVFRWFQNGMLMSNYFLRIAGNEVKRFKRQQALTQPLPEFNVEGPDDIDNRLEQDENTIANNSRIRNVYYNILEMLDGLELTHLQKLILEEHYWGNELIRLEILEEINRENLQNPGAKKIDVNKRLNAKKVSIKEICQRTINPDSGKPYTHQAGYSAAAGLLDKVARHQNLPGYLTDELELAIKTEDSEATLEIASIIKKFGKLLSLKMVFHLLSVIDPLTNQKRSDYREYLLNLLKKLKVTSTIKHLEKLLSEIYKRQKNELSSSSDALISLVGNFQLVDSIDTLPALLEHIEKSTSQGQIFLSDALTNVLENFKTTLDVNSLDIIAFELLKPGASNKKEAIFKLLENATWTYNESGLDKYLNDKTRDLDKPEESFLPFLALLHLKEDLSSFKNRELIESYVMALLRKSLRGDTGSPPAAGLVKLLLKLGRSREEIHLLL